MVGFIIGCLDGTCPISLMKVQKQIEKMAVGDVLVAQIGYSCAMKSVPEWVRNQRYNAETEKMDDGEWETVIEKTEQKGYR